VASDQQRGGRRVVLDIDRDRAARLGVTAQAIDDTLYDAFGQRQISTIFTQLNLYRVILEVTPDQRRDANGLRNLYVRSGAGTPVPIANFVRFSQKHEPLAITHQDQFPAVTLSFNLGGSASLGDAVSVIRKAYDGLEPPPGLHMEFQGAAAAFTESL